MDNNYEIWSIFNQIDIYEVLVVDFLGILFCSRGFEEDVVILADKKQTDKNTGVNQLLYPRKVISELIKLAINQGKGIYIYNNSHLTKKEVLEFLTSQDILLKPENIVLKIEECVDANDKKEWLWLTTQKQVEDFEGEILKLDSPMEMLRTSAWKDILEEIKTDADRIVVTELAARAFNDPFKKTDAQGRPLVDTMEDFVYLFIGPFVIGFMRWFLRQVKKERYNKILFSTRDGYIIQKIYNEMLELYGLHDMPDSIYFPISRTLCVSAAVYTREDIIAFAKVRYAYEPEAMLMRRFGLDKADVLPYEKETYSNIIEYALAHEDKILARSREIRENYLLFMKNAGLKKGEKYALFDFVSSGTCQLLLKYICDLDLEGVYACRYFPFKGITNYTSEEDKYKLPIQAYIVNESTTEKETYFFQNYNFLEIIFTSDEPSVASMSQQGPILDREQRSEQDLEVIRKAQSTIREYVQKLGSRLTLADEISFALIDKILSLKDSQYTREECLFLDDCELIEDFGQGRIKLKRQ